MSAKKKINKKGSIGYKGQVKIQIVKNNKVVKEINSHNRGNSPLFSFIAECLTGNMVAGNRPNYIHFYNGNVRLTQINTPSTDTKVVSNVQGNDIGTEYSFIVPAMYVTANEEVNELRLYSANNLNIEENYSAQLLLDSNSTFVIASYEQANTSILITYTLVITNAVVESEE